MSAEHALHKALVALWKTDAGVAAAGCRGIYDEIVQTGPFPYVHLATTQAVNETVDCFDLRDVYLDVHVWDRPDGLGFTRIHKLASALERSATAAADADELFLTGGVVLSTFRHLSTRTFRSSDGKTLQGVVTFEALIESE